MDNDQSILDATKKGEMVQFDLVNMKDQISDQMRAFLLNMMPKEAFDRVIETAWKQLTEPRPEIKNSYGTVTQDEKPSELEEMIMVEMRAELKKRVAAWAAEWGKTEDCSLGAKVMFSELVSAASSKFIHRVGAQIVREAAGVLSNNEIVAAPCANGSCYRSCVPGSQCQCGTWN